MSCSFLSLVWRALMGTVFVRTVRQFDRVLICVYVMQFFTAYSYFIMTAVLVQYLSFNLGLSDVQASLLYTAFGVALSATGMVFGLMIDQLSVFVAVMMGAGVALLSKLLFLFVVPIATETVEWKVGWSTVLLMTLLPLGETAMAQSMGIGIKRYAPRSLGSTPSIIAVSDMNTRSADDKATAAAAPRSIEYSISYSIQNVAALLAYASLSIVRAALGPELGKSEALVNLAAMGLALPVLLFTMGTALLGMRWDTYDIDAAAAKREDDLLVDDSLASEDMVEGRLQGCAAAWERVRPRWMSRLFVTGDMRALFARYLVVSVGLTGAKSLYRHLEATLPKYAQRTFDPEYDYALLMLVNPGMVIVLAAFVQSFLVHFDTLVVIIVGATLCSAGAALFMIPVPAAAYMAVVVFTLGEIVWSPRFVDYVYQLAPRGHEGAFGSVATIPLFLAKIPVGLMSGYLLEHYCPAYGACESAALWGSIAAFSLTSPLVLLAAYRWVTSYAPTDDGHTTHDLIVDLGAMNGSGGASTDNLYGSPAGTPRGGSSSSSTSVKLKTFAFGSGHRRSDSISEGANGTPRRASASHS
jgi:predicted MFS family arabinose efflux permease